MAHGPEPGTPLAVVAASDEVLALPEADERLLNRVERERAAMFRRERDRVDFVAAHLLVRLCAARLLGVEPAEVAFGQQCPGCGQTGHGRPLLTDRPEVYLSLSHSAGMVAAAAGTVPVGVDVERPATTSPGIEQRVLAPAEAELVRQQPDPTAAFLRLWVRKESLIKIGRADLDSLADVDLSALPLLPAEDAPLSHRFGDLHLLDWTDRERGLLIGVAATAPVRLGTAAVPLSDLD